MIVIQRVVGRSLALSQVRGNVLRIGRGTNAELRSENPAVALEHAIIEGVSDGYTVTDRGSITGTYVNGKPVEKVTLAKGDLIEVGDLRLEVQAADAGKPLFLRIVANTPGAAAAGDDFEEDDAPSSAVAAGGGAAVRAPKIDYGSAFALRRMYLTKGVLIAALLILVFIVIAQVTQEPRQSAFMPGGVSSAHGRVRDVDGKSIAKNCKACHDPWRGVSDASCTGCHAKEAHSELASDRVACSECHLEHRGNVKLAVVADPKCVACHGNIRSHVKSSALALASVRNVRAFDEQHPDFVYPRDADTLRFNHKLHLQAAGIFNASGRREVLTCAGCHKLVDTKGKVDPAPIAFAAACQRCHKLSFDPRFPDAEVPHGGDPGLAYGFILSTYAGNRDIADKSPDEVRRILTAHPTATPDERALLNAEAVIKTKCSLCHEVTRRGGRLVATPPIIATKWLQHARFTHTQHTNVACESCHENARSSVSTSDVLMPSRKSCVDCHGPRVVNASLGAASVSSSCVTCHEYHERSRNLMTKMAPSFARTRRGTVPSETEGELGMLGTILLWAIVLLMLVVLIPIALAWYQRIRSRDLERAKPAAAPATKKAPPPPMTSAAAAPPAAPATPAAPARGATTTAPAAAPVAAPPAAPPPAAKPSPDATQMSRPEDRAAAEPAGTEMVQWYGMLHCTIGPLEGQRFIIEEEGLYIGRDPQLAKIVIPDTRVSKRHVRIIPRDGRVWAIDQNSTNGTFLKVGGQRIAEVQLKRGDTLILADGAATFVYQI
jgi:pSer/pThr/pTyr-binding forkhead associated (FHA) protein